MAALTKLFGSKRFQTSPNSLMGDFFGLKRTDMVRRDPTPNMVPVAGASGDFAAEWIGEADLPVSTPVVNYDFSAIGIVPVSDNIFYRRTTNGTCRNELGIIENVPVELPRIEYDVNGNAKGVLIEPPISTNSRLLWSEDYTNAVWTKGQTTIDAVGAVISPDGVNNAQIFAPTAASSQHHMYQEFSRTVSTDPQQVSSFFYRPRGAQERVRFRLGDSTATWTANFDIDVLTNKVINVSVTGTIVITDIVGWWIEPHYNGFYRFMCSVKTPNTATTYRATLFLMDPTSTLSYAGNVNDGLHIWGFNSFLASHLDLSYYPVFDSTTPGFGGDTFAINFQANLLPRTGTLVVELDKPIWNAKKVYTNPIYAVLARRTTQVDDYIALSCGDDTSGDGDINPSVPEQRAVFKTFFYDGGVSQSILNTDIKGPQGLGKVKHAFAFMNNDDGDLQYRSALNGVPTAENTNATSVSNMNTISFQTANNNAVADYHVGMANSFAGGFTLKSVVLYPTYATEDQLKNLTRV